MQILLFLPNKYDSDIIIYYNFICEILKLYSMKYFVITIKNEYKEPYVLSNIISNTIKKYEKLNIYNVLIINFLEYKYSIFDMHKIIKINHDMLIINYNNKYKYITPYISINNYFYITYNNFNSIFHYFIYNKICKCITNNYIIYITCHGESENNYNKIIGGNSYLTENGIKYANILIEYFEKEYNNTKFDVLCSNLLSAKQTAYYFMRNKKNKYDIQEYIELNDIYYGDLEKKQYKIFFEELQNNTYYTSFPNGESYYDVNKRLCIIYNYLKNIKNNTIIISHQSISKLLFSYLLDINPIKYIHNNIQSNCLYKFTPINGKYKISLIDLHINSIFNDKNT